MLRSLLCCVIEEKEDEPCVAYARQDDGSRTFNLLSTDAKLSVVKKIFYYWGHYGLELEGSKGEIQGLKVVLSSFSLTLFCLFQV